MGLLRAMFTLDEDSGMSDRDRITLSPIEKWKQYRRFPYKLVVHTMLLALTTIQVRPPIDLSSALSIDFSRGLFCPYLSTVELSTCR